MQWSKGSEGQVVARLCQALWTILGLWLSN